MRWPNRIMAFESTSMTWEDADNPRSAQLYGHIPHRIYVLQPKRPRKAKRKPKGKR